MEQPQIKIAIILGSVRPKNNTAKAVLIVRDELSNHPYIDVSIIDPGKIDLPLPGLPGDQNVVKNMQKLVSESAGVILATPEYHGSYSSVIKLVIDNLGFPSALKGKPVALLGVAAGKIGAIKALESLRSICSHVGSIVLPGAISIANVNSVFDADGSCNNPAIENQIRSVATNLINYVSQRVCPKTDLEEIVRSEAL